MVDEQALVELCRKAGRATLAFYQSDDLDVEIKSDNSPLTQADIASHNIIMAGLQALSPGIPIMSEEGNSGDLHEHVRCGGLYWLVDPLDGTKEFIRGKQDYTINIALIEHHQPIAGFIYAPVLQTSWWTAPHSRIAHRQIDGQQRTTIRAGRKDRKGLYVVSSKSHANEKALETFLGGQAVVKSLQVGSSLKFCRVAEGSADLYPRFGPTMEWDTGAGHAIAHAAGAEVIDLDTNKPLIYGKIALQTGREKDYLNGDFLVRAKSILTASQ